LILLRFEVLLELLRERRREEDRLADLEEAHHQQGHEDERQQQKHGTKDPAAGLGNVDQQIAAFALYNQVRESGGMLVAATGRPPAQLTLREDLRTRLAWGLVYQVHGLSDEEKIDALAKSADARGMVLSPGVLPYLLTHSRRDMQSLSAILDALDRYSLETQRPITMPLLRELLQLSDAQTTS
jgi:DnaA family protein